MKNIIWEITMEEKNNKEKIAEESVQSNENTVAEEANNKELEINKEETTVEQESAEAEKIVETAEQKEAAESTKEVATQEDSEQKQTAKKKDSKSEESEPEEKENGRYKVIAKLEPNLWTYGSPVLFEKGTLERDQVSNINRLSLIFTNIYEEKEIRDLYITIYADDGEGNVEQINHSYLAMGQEYLASKGKAAKITIKNENAVKFIIKIDRVVFVDGSVWTKKDAVLESAGEMEDVEVFAQAKTKDYEDNYISGMEEVQKDDSASIGNGIEILKRIAWYKNSKELIKTAHKKYDIAVKNEERKQASENRRANRQKDVKKKYMTATKLDLVKVEDWGLFTDTTKPIIIAGPCSAESEQQVFETAKGLKAAGVEVLRAGIWKPRTRPNCFEGVGSEGLVWMKRVQRELGMKISTEVANVKHVYEALKAGVDMLWIGARTSANPFAMQEIADALKGTDIPVLVKNPVNPDVELWIGALERLNMAGLKKIGVIHRGFSAYVKSKYRNVPQWQLPIEIKRRFPDMLMICDPSHISGKREYIQEVSQQAMDLGFDGLIIESHICPEIALSDAAQQVTPTSLREILGKLIIRDIDSENIEYKENIDELRAQIDDIDNDILELLTRRMKVSDEIGKYKKQNNITILQPGRWDKILEKVFVKGAEMGLDNEFLEKVFKAIHQASIDRQTKVMNE